MKINIDTDLQYLTNDGKHIVVRQEAEEAILKLFEAKEQIEQAISDLKSKIAQEVEKLPVAISTIKTSKLRVYYRSYGARYTIDRAYLPELDKNFYETKVTYSAKIKEIDAFVTENGVLPVGINEVDRPKTLSITVQNETTD